MKKEKKKEIDLLKIYDENNNYFVVRVDGTKIHSYTLFYLCNNRNDIIRPPPLC